MEVPYFLKKVNDSLVFNQSGELLYYVPQVFFDRNYAFIEGQYVSLLGVFNYTIVDDKGKNNGLHFFNLPTRFICKPGKIETIKNVSLIKQQDPEDYMILHFAKGEEVISSVMVPQDIEHVEDLYKIFLRAKLPTTIPHKDLYDLFDLNAQMNGFKYNLNAQMFGLVFSEITRSSKDPNVAYRLSGAKDENDYRFMSIVDIPKYISPYQAITSQNWDEGIVGAIINPGGTTSPMETLLTEANEG